MSTVFTEKCHAKNVRKVSHKNTTPQHSGECGFAGGHGSWLLPVFVFWGLRTVYPFFLLSSRANRMGRQLLQADSGSRDRLRLFLTLPEEKILSKALNENI